MKAVKSKLGQCADVSCVHESGPRGIILGVTFLDSFYNLPLMKKFRHSFLRNCKGYKVESRYTHGP